MRKSRDRYAHGIVTENAISIEFQTSECAKKALAIAKDLLMGIPKEYGYGSSGESTADLLTIENNAIVLSDCNDVFFVVDFIDVMKDVVKAIAAELKGSEFSFRFDASDFMMPEGLLEGSYDGKTLSLETSICGEGLGCPICGEFIVDRKKYKRGKLYTCPECHAKLDLSETFDEDDYLFVHSIETVEVE